MFFKRLLDKQNRVHVKILLPFLCLVLLFAIAEVVVSNTRMSRSIDIRTIKLLQNHTLLFNEIIKEQEERVSFYAQFMADVTKLSDQLTDMSAGRSVLIYLMESLKKDRVRIGIYRKRTHVGKKKQLIQKGFLGIRTTSLVEADAEGSLGLNIAAVAPVEGEGGIGEVIVAEYPLDNQFLETLKRKTGGEFTLIYDGKLVSSTLSPSLQRQSFVDILDQELREDVQDHGSTVIKDVFVEKNPQKIAFNPLSVNFKNQGMYAISLSLKKVLINKRTILTQNILIVSAILIGVVLLSYIVVKTFTKPILELAAATREVAAGNLKVNIDVKTGDEVGELGKSFNRMVNQLRQSEAKLQSQMDEMSHLYSEVSEERNISKSILDNLTNGVVMLDPDQMVVLINPIAEQWLGVREKQVKGIQIVGEPGDPSLEPLYQLAAFRPSDRMISCWKHFGCDKKECPAHGSRDLRCWFISGTYCRDDVAQEYPEKIEGCKACGVYGSYTSIFKEKDEVKVEEVELFKPQRRILKVHHCPLFDDHGGFLGQIMVLNDITMEREIDRLKTEFVSLVSHELRTPLSSIKAYAEILLRKPERERDQQVEFLNIINEETERLTRLINDILDVTKIEERRIEFEKRPIDIQQLIDKSISAQQSSAQNKDIEIETKASKDIPEIWGDEDSLIRVLVNLLNNAIKFTPEGGKIEVSAKYSQEDQRSSGEVEVRVRDNGIGIPHEDLQRVFEKFYRSDRSYDQEPSTGLGLYLCKGIVERHGGRIWAESTEEKGSTFVFTLPAASKREAPDRSIYDIQADALLQHSKESRERISILVVDDDMRVRRFLRYYMQEEGFRVYEAEDGRQALELAKEIRPNVILLDTIVPGMDGYEVMEALREDEQTKHIPVIVVSGSEDSTLAMALGAANYLVKPFARETLIRAVNEILNQGKG